MSPQIDIPFYSIENAHQYIRLLSETVAEAKRDIVAEINLSTDQTSQRVRALRIVDYNLDKLQRHLFISGRTLSDLRCLRRLLLEERIETSQVQSGSRTNPLPYTRAIPVAEPKLVRRVRAVAAHNNFAENAKKAFSAGQPFRRE